MKMTVQNARTLALNLLALADAAEKAGQEIIEGDGFIDSLQKIDDEARSDLAAAIASAKAQAAATESE